MAIINGLSSSINTDTKSGQNAQSLEEDLNRFLTLLTTQLQHQDPLDPMDATEFTSQLVQFASVEQQIYQNSNLEKLLALQETNKLASLVDFMDNVIEVESQDLVLDEGNARFTYTIPVGAVDTKITISDVTGAQVFTADGSTEQSFVSDIGVPTGQWAQYSVSVDPDEDTVTFYFDGEPVGAPQSFTDAGAYAGASRFLIGANEGSGAAPVHHFEGGRDNSCSDDAGP